ncbi:MAG: hypothetical protein ACOYPR_14225, partial [Saprospiraceae bacterium]
AWRVFISNQGNLKSKSISTQKQKPMFNNQSNTMPQPWRTSEFIRYKFESQRNAFNYQVRGKKFNFELYPELDCSFPVIRFEHEPFTIRESLPMIEACRGWSEYKGKSYQVISTYWSDGTFSKNNTSHRVYAFQDGKEVHSVTFEGSLWESQAAMSVLLHMDFQANAKDIPQSKIKTVVQDLNEDDFTRTFTARIAADGLAVLETSGDAIVLRKKGIDLKTFQFWKWAKVLEFENWKVIICERYDGKFDYALSDPNGQRPEHGAGVSPSLIYALVSAFDLWKNIPK